MPEQHRLSLPAVCLGLVWLLAAGCAAAVEVEVDADAARKLAKENRCFRCHAVSREKNGPAWSAIATKYQGKPDGEQKLVKHLTSAPKVRLREDDVEEEHKVVKYGTPQELENLARWVLSL